MGRIPEYQRRQLPSAAVGTPGVDLSTARVFGQVVRSAAQVGGIILSQAAQEESARRQEAARRQRELDAIEAQRQKSLDTLATTNRAIQFENAFDQRKAELMEENLDTPERLPQLLQEFGQEQIRSISQGIGNEQNALNFQNVAANSLRSKLTGLRGDVRRQQSINANNDLESAADGLTTQASNISSVDDLENLVDRVDGMEESALLVKGKQASKFLSDKKSAVVKQGWNAIFEQSPDTAEALLEEDVFKENLTAEERNRYRNRVQTRKRAIERDERDRVRFEERNLVLDSRLKAARGEASYGDVDQLRELARITGRKGYEAEAARLERLLEAERKAEEKRKREKKLRSPEAFSARANINNKVLDFAKGGVPGVGVTESDLDDLSAAIEEANDNGYLTGQQYLNSLQKVKDATQFIEDETRLDAVEAEQSTRNNPIVQFGRIITGLSPWADSVYGEGTLQSREAQEYVQTKTEEARLEFLETQNVEPTESQIEIMKETIKADFLRGLGRE